MHNTRKIKEGEGTEQAPAGGALRSTETPWREEARFRERHKS